MADSSKTPAEDFASALAEVLWQFGRRVVDRPEQLRGALSDTLGASAGEYRGEVDAVVAASREGVASEIRDADASVAASPEQIRAWFDQLVSAGVSLRDAALATRSWAEVFDASETARVTSELSEQLLGQDAPAKVMRPVRDDEVTDVGDSSVLGALGGDRTRMPDLSEIGPPPPLPTSVPVAPGEGSPPPVPPVPEASGAAADEVPPSLLTRAAPFWPAMAAAVAAIVALAVGIPIIAANATPEALPAFDPVPPLDETGIFDRRDVAQFALSQDDLAQLVPSKTYTFGPLPSSQSDYALGFTAADGTCAAAFASITPDGPRATTLIFTSAAYDQTNWLWVDSGSRWYPSPEDAGTALDTLSPEGCAAPAALNNGTTFAATYVVDAPVWINGVQIIRSTTTVATTPAWILQRHCYGAENVVSCVAVSGTATGALGSVGETTLVELLDETLTTVVPYREQEEWR